MRPRRKYMMRGVALILFNLLERKVPQSFRIKTNVFSGLRTDESGRKKSTKISFLHQSLLFFLLYCHK